MLSNSEKLRAQRAKIGSAESPDDRVMQTAGNKAPECLRVQRGNPAANIFITCPTTGVPVTTGLTTRWVVFHSLPPVAVPLCCPACGQVHNWKPQDAWICHPASPPDLSVISASS
jgi:hypothetical protein